MIDRSLNYGRDAIAHFLAETSPKHVVVDLGAGPGTDLLRTRETEPNARLVAIESDPKLIALLGKRGIESHALDIERDRLPLGDGEADAIIANQILEHTKDIFWVMHEATRVLREGGTLIVGVPNLASLHNRVLLAAGRQPSVIKTDSAHVRGFTNRDLTDFFESCFPGGYRLEGLRGANFYPLPSAFAKPMAKFFPTLAWGLMLRFVKTRAYKGGFLHRLDRAGFETNFYRGSGNKPPQ